MLCIQCNSEVIDLNGVCPKCGAELVKSGEDSARIVQNVSGGVTLSADEQINIQGDTVGRDKTEVKNDYSVSNTIYQFNLIANTNRQTANDYQQEEASNLAPNIASLNTPPQIRAKQEIRVFSQRSSALSIVSPVIVPTDHIWRLPTIDAIFAPAERPRSKLHEDEFLDNARRIERILFINDVSAKVVRIEMGPTITRYCLEPGYREELEVIDEFRDITAVRWRRIQVDAIKKLLNQIALDFDLPVRFASHYPGRSCIGIEIPNVLPEVVFLKNVIQASNYAKASGQLRLAIGEDSATGTAIVDTLVDIRHLSITGVLGSGKSTCIQTILISLLMKNTPNDFCLVLIDPRGTHFHKYSQLPHLLLPVITNKFVAVELLEKMLVEMETRYEIFSKTNVRTIFEYDSIIAKDNRCLPALIIIVENLPDLIEVDSESVRQMLINLTEKGHNVGMHLIVSSQAPLQDEMARFLEYFFPTKFVFALDSVEESVAILGQSGAEYLLKRGDMLIAHRPSSPNPQRVQGATVAIDELTLLLNYWKIQSE
jgi:DNA segregation ATPase FtsK/SpoIIIE, S-DNA-T family